VGEAESAEMTKRKRSKFGAEELRILKERSKEKCECCGLDIVIDKHHIWEFAKNGPDIASNILCLCPSCHRVLPTILTKKDQKFLQTKNCEKRSDSFSFYSDENIFEVGSTTHKGVNEVLRIEGKPIMYPYQIGKRFYVNVVLLEDFEPFLLVIANRVIYRSEKVIVTSRENGLKIMKGEKLIFEIEKSKERIKVRTNFRYKGIPFIFDDSISVLPGFGYLHNVSFENNGGASITFRS
jgi:hypothetical protein